MAIDKHLARRAAAWLVLGSALLASACQSNDAASTAEAAPAQPTVTQSELRAYCPPVVLREGTAFFTTYAPGGDGDSTKVAYQNSIADVTRSCTRENGMVNMTVAAAGRVVPGPSGGPGTVTMPIRVAVTDGETVIYSQIHQHQVQVGGGAATQFVFSDSAISFPEPTGRTIRAFIGFDAGPAKEKADDGL